MPSKVWNASEALRGFPLFAPVVVSKAAQLSSCICVFMGWDQERKRLVENLRGLDVPTLVLVIAENEDAGREMDPGPMLDDSQNFQLLALGKIQQGLMNL